MPKRKLPPNEEIISMYDSGMSTGEIAEICGVKPVTVVSLLRRLNHPMRDPQEAAIVARDRGRLVKTAYWQGKKQPPEMIERRTSKIRGDRHYLWKGGKHSRQYRRVVEKLECAWCGGRLNLSIHHLNLDHYDDRSENLEVLCASCHMALHKKAYWDAVHSGKEPPQSNGPVGWQRRDLPEKGGGDGAVSSAT